MTKTITNKIKIIGSLIVFGFIVVLSSTFAFASEITPENIVNAINKEREARFLSPLRVNSSLQNAAKNKSIDMITRNYFEHYAYGQTPWSFILKEDYNYSVAGENLALGYSTAEGVVNAWMNSPTHRANILNPEYGDIGVGVVKGAFTEDNRTAETTITTEMLAKPKPKITQIYDRIVEVFSRIF